MTSLSVKPHATPWTAPFPHMSANSLKGAVEIALKRIGKEGTLRIVPELGAIEVSTAATLANLLLDPNNVVFKEDALLKVVKHCMEIKGISKGDLSGGYQREIEALLSKSTLR